MSDNIQKGRKVLVFIDDRIESAYLISSHSASFMRVRVTNGDIKYVDINLCFMTAEHASKVLETKRRWWVNEIRQVKKDLIKITNEPHLHNAFDSLYFERMGRVFSLAYIDARRRLEYEHISSLRNKIKKFEQFKDGYASSLKEIHNFAHHNSFFTDILKILRKLWV